MKKRILSMLLAIFMVVGMLPTTAFAAESGDTTPAEITGVSIHLDGNTTINSGHITVTSENSIYLIVNGTNLENLSEEYYFDIPYMPVYMKSAGSLSDDGTIDIYLAPGWLEGLSEYPIVYVTDDGTRVETGIYLTYDDGTGEEGGEEATRVIYVDESTFFASGYSRFYDADENLLTAMREEQEDGWVKYTMPADAKYYHTFDGHMGGGGGGNYPELPTNADTYDPFSDTWSCSHPGYAEGNCRLCGEPCPGHTYDNACDDKCNVCSEIREVGDHVYDGAEDAECNECGYVRDITPAQITGVSITVDSVEYTEGEVTITPTSTVTLTVHGTALHSGSDDHTVDYANGLYLYVNPDYFEISEDGTTATYAPSVGDFAKSSNFEITYCNNYTDTANRTVVSTGIYLTYDDGIAEEDQARITGMSITIDGVVYDSSNTSAEDPAVITPNTGFITITVHGTALQNCTTDHMVSYYAGSSEPILPNSLWRFEADGTSAFHHYSSASALSDFARNTTPYELQYSNNGSFNEANPAIGSGVYIVYDDSTGGEEDTTPAEITGISITVDGETYTSGNVTITPTSTVTLTITGTNLQNGTEDHRVDYALGSGLWATPDYCDVSEDGTTATFAPSPGRFTSCSNYEVVYYNNYTDDINRAVVSSGIYLTYESGIAEEDEARITGVSITVDGETYTSGNVTITPNSTITLTVTGTNLQNGTDDNYLEYAFETARPVTQSFFTISEDGTSATFVPSFEAFDDCRNYEIVYYNNYTDSDNRVRMNTGIYLTYESGIAEEDQARITGVSITVDGVTYTSGDVTITPTSTVTLTVTGTNLQNATKDHTVYYASGLGGPVSRETFEISEDGTTATKTLPALDFAGSSHYEMQYCNNFIDSDNRTEVPTGIYLTYDDGTGGEGGGDDTTPAEITGVSITVDGVEYTTGNVTITPDTQSIIVTVTGTNFANLSDANILDLGPGLTIFMDTWRWEIDPAANTATADFSDMNSEFGDHNGSEIMYSNDSNQNWTGTGIYLTYDDGIAEEDKAQITGVSITVDGETYTSGNVTITPTSTITLTVTGTNLLSGTEDNRVDYADGVGETFSRDYFEISEDGTVATYAPPVNLFANSSNYEIKYYNNYTDTDNRITVPTGIYLTYDDEVNTTLAIGDNEIADGYTYTYTAEQDGSLYITVAELYYRETHEVDEVNLGYWCDIEINGTAITDFVNSIEVKTGDTVTVELVSLDNDIYNGTINLSWDASVMAEITGVSITVDGETYTSGNVTIHPVSTVTLTVTGTGLQNSTGDNRVDYAYGAEFPVKLDSFEISEDGTIATYTIHAKAFVNNSNFEMKYYNNYSDSESRSAAPTDIYLTYDETIPDASGKLIVDMGDLRGDGWSGAAIQIYKNGSLETTVTVGAGKAFNTVFLDYDSTATYEIKWVEGSSDSECSFNIYVDGEEKRSVANAYALEEGETLWSQGDIGGEEDPNTFTVTLDDSIEGGTISVDSPTYTVGDRVIVDAHPDEGYVLDKVIATNAATGEPLTISGTAFEMPAAHVNVTAIFIKGYDLEIIFDDGGNTVDFPPSADEGETVTVEFTAKEGFELQLVKVIDDTSDQLVPHEMVDDNTFTFLMPAGEVTIYFSFWQIGTDLETIYYKGPWTNMQVNFLNDGSDIGAPYGVLTPVEEGIYAITNIPEHTSQLTIINMDTHETVTIKSIPTDGSDLYNADTGAWETYVPSAQITGVSITIDGVEYVGSDTSAENPAVITSEAASVILTVHGTNLQNATSDYLVVFGPAGNSIGLGGAQWTMSEDGSRASYEMTWLVEEFTESLPTWEIKYSTNGEDLEDAVTALHVKYEHIAGEEEPIVIIQQPTDGEAKLGERYCVEVIAQGEGLKYQWYFRNAGASSFSKSSVTDSTYDDVMTKARMNRQVYCVITDSHGNSVTTDTASLIALKSVDLAITKEPESVTANYGERFTVTAEAVGDGVTYEWYYLDPDGEAWLSANVRSATYSATMSEKIDGRAVYCVARDIWGNQVATNAVFLRCERAELAITKQPNDASAKLGDRFNVEVIAQGDGLKYQWYWRTKGQENWNVSGQRDNSYDDVMTSARHNREVYCVITDAWGDSVTTEIATITGIPEVTLAITRQPESQTVTIGDMFNVTFDAVGDGLRYQWYFRQAGTEVWYTSGQRDNSYDDVMTRARHNRELYCVVTDAWGNTVETSPVVVIMAAPRYELAITAQPENESAKLGEMFCVTVEAQGDELRYQWYWRTKGQENWNVSGQRDNTYDDVMTKARHNREVKCVITDMWGKSVETEIALITGIPTATLAITQQPTDAEAALGETFCAGVEAQGDGLTYQWYFKNAGTDVWHVSGVKDNTYDDVMTNARAGREVYCVITDAWGNTVTTETVTLIRTET